MASGSEIAGRGATVIEDTHVVFVGALCLRKDGPVAGGLVDPARSTIA
jgi:hypothetical protein